MTKKNQLVIDLGKITLNAEQRKILQAGIHKAVAAKLKRIDTGRKKTDVGKKEAKSLTRGGLRAVAAVTTATIKVDFTNTNPGTSEITATLKGQKKTLNQSGSISFTNVNSADIIRVQVDSLGSTTATIDINADPTQLNFPPGSHSGRFFIN